METTCTDLKYSSPCPALNAAHPRRHAAHRNAPPVSAGHLSPAGISFRLNPCRSCFLIFQTWRPSAGYSCCAQSCCCTCSSLTLLFCVFEPTSHAAPLPRPLRSNSSPHPPPRSFLQTKAPPPQRPRLRRRHQRLFVPDQALLPTAHCPLHRRRTHPFLQIARQRSALLKTALICPLCRLTCPLLPSCATNSALIGKKMSFPAMGDCSG